MIRREEGLKPEQIPGPVHCAATEITWVTFLILWNQSGIDESTHMTEGRVVFRQGLLSKVLKEFKVAEMPEGTSNLSPMQQKRAHCTGSRRERGTGKDPRGAVALRECLQVQHAL